MSVKKLAGVALLSLASTAVGAASYSFNYTALSSNQFQAVSGNFGASIVIGDTVTLTLTASAGNQFLATSSDTMWAILGLDSPQPGGGRTADYTWSFSSNSTVVGTGSSTGANTCCIHMAPDFINIGFNGYFDTYSWTGTLLSDPGQGNIAADIGYGAAPLPLYGGTWQYGYTTAQFVTSAVPEPETYALMLAGLGLMGTVVRRRKLQVK